DPEPMEFQPVRKGVHGWCRQFAYEVIAVLGERVETHGIKLAGCVVTGYDLGSELDGRAHPPAVEQIGLPRMPVRGGAEVKRSAPGVAGQRVPELAAVGPGKPLELSDVTGIVERLDKLLDLVRADHSAGIAVKAAHGVIRGNPEDGFARRRIGDASAVRS